MGYQMWGRMSHNLNQGYKQAESGLTRVAADVAPLRSATQLTPTVTRRVGIERPRAGGGGSVTAVTEPAASSSAATAWGQRGGVCFQDLGSAGDAVQQAAAPDAGDRGSNQRRE